MLGVSKTFFENKVIVLIRITCRDKWPDRQQIVEGVRLITSPARNPKVSYTHRNGGLRILWGQSNHCWASRRDICPTSEQRDPRRRRDNGEEDLHREFLGGEEDS
jgi:hypothetical protein